MTPSLGLINLLEQPRELGKTVYLLFTSLLQKHMIKDTDFIQTQELHKASYVERSLEFPCPLLVPLQHLHVFTNPEAL